MPSFGYPDGLSQDELDAGLGQRLHWLVYVLGLGIRRPSLPTEGSHSPLLRAALAITVSTHPYSCNWDASGSSGVENADSVVPYTPPRVSEVCSSKQGGPLRLLNRTQSHHPFSPSHSTPQGTGFHRAVFVLLQQTGGAVDAAALGKAVAERDGAVRLAALADTHRLQPIGLAYFQSAA